MPMMPHARRRVADIALLLVRVAIGSMFAFHYGLQKVMAGPEMWTRLGGAFERLIGIHLMPTFWGLMATISEFGGGLCLIAGVLFRPACALMLFTMTVAVVSILVGGYGISGAAIPLLFWVILVALIVTGPGRLTLAAFRTGLMGVMIAAAAVAGCETRPAPPVPAPRETSVRFATGRGPGSVEIADFNRDRCADIAVANETSNDVTILLGDCKGGFRRSPGSPFPAGPSPNDIAIGDFNRDGTPDLAFANHEQKFLTVLLGDGRGGFTPAPGSPFAVEVRPHTHGVAAGDFDGDGNLDLVTDSWGTDQLEVLLGDGKGKFKTPGIFLPVGKHPYQRVRAGDVDGDGKADIVAGNLEGDNVSVLLGAGRGTFRQPPGSPFPCGDSPFNVAIGDVNGDGKADLAVVDSPGSTSDRHGREGLAILFGDGAGGFRLVPGSPFAAGPRPNRVAIGDMNGDGIGDVAVSSPDGHTVTIWLMGRQGTRSSSLIPIDGEPKGVAIADLNGDRVGDLVIADHQHDSVIVMLRVP
jgi:uncharacterized membrane protein YphA (DoxX/SURF4 family)